MTFDTTVPPSLKRIQKWFGSIIERPIDGDSRINPLSPRGVPIEIEACDYIRPSPTLRPAQRIELYNQQYWWRLLSVMHENFPFLTRLFGYYDMNQSITIPYLVKYPSSHWSLNRLGENIEKWINEDYKAGDKELVSIAASIDWGYCNSFSAAELAPVSMDNLPVPGNLESLLTAKLFLQPHIRLYCLDADYFNLRYEMIKEPIEHWVENDFPALARDQKKYYYILYRDFKTDLAWNPLNEAQYTLLSRFQKGASVEECCDWLEKQRKKAFKDAGTHIQTWFKEWIARHWLTLEQPQSEEHHAQKPRKKK